MGRHNDDEFVTYSVSVPSGVDGVPPDSVKIKIRKFFGGGPREWLKWSYEFRSLAKKKQWTDAQKGANLVLLMEGDLEVEVQQLLDEATEAQLTFEQFYTNVGLLSVPSDFSEDLDNEIYGMSKRRDETVLKFARRLKEAVRMFAELPEDAEVIPEVQQCRYFKHGMPAAWLDKLAGAGVTPESLTEFVAYFSRIEKAEQRQTTRDRGSHNNASGQREKPNSQRKSNKKGNEHKVPFADQKPYHQQAKTAGGEKWCSFHKTNSHSNSECFAQKNKVEEHKHAETMPKTATKKTKNYPRVYRSSFAESSSDDGDEYKLIRLLDKKPPAKIAPLRIQVQLRRGGQRFDALLDSGASKSIVNQAALDVNIAVGRQLVPATPTVFETVSGSVTSAGSTVMQFFFPRLKSDSIITHRFEVIHDSKDAMVIGRDLMNSLGLILNFRNKVVQWDDESLTLNTGRSDTNTIGADQHEVDEFPDETKELDDKGVQPEQLLPSQLSGTVAQQYLDALRDAQALYDGHLGRMRFDDYVLPLSADFRPTHAKPYPIAKSQEEKAKAKIRQLIELDVLEQIYDSEMASPAFFLVKPDGSLRLLVDFRGLNKFLRRSPYYVPKIREVLLRLSGAKCVSTFDANLGYYARRLARASRQYTAFCLPFGKFQYKRLPMGISTAPDEYQACMERIFGDLAFVAVYLDDILVFSADECEHLEHLRIVFGRLKQYGVTLNGKKCHILRPEVDYLGYTLTADGIKPQAKKIQAIQKIAVPRNRKELRRFLGMINYYRDMVPNKTALCQPLHRLTSSKVPFTWLSSDTEAFRAVQRAFAEAVLLSFPDFEQPFHVYADASGLQLGGIIMQGLRILACYSRSLNKHQINYTTMELELLSIVELLREYRTMLLGFPVIVHTDHKNLIYPTETSLRVKRWKLLLSEYRLTIQYIQGEKNVGADAFSRMRFDTQDGLPIADEICATSNEPECVMHGPVILQHQEGDEMIAKIKSACLANTNNPDYQLMPLLGCMLVAYQKRVVLPESLRDDMIDWYHQNLGHPASERQYKTMRSTFYWPRMETSIFEFVKKCLTCKRAKVHGGKQDYGLLPPRTLKTVNPFDTVHVDLIGPYDDGSYGITMIDQATRWLEVGVQPDRLALTTAESFDREWLCRYPRPREVVHDLGTEFTGDEFQELLRSYGIKAKPITSKNPQANAICERVHLEILNVIRCHEDVDWKKTIDYAAFAVRAGYHSILNASPGQLLFGEDMISRQLHQANWNYMSKRRFEAILADNDRENDKRLEHFYQPGDQVMLRVPKQFRAKLRPVADGPFPIREVHDNGTITIDKGAAKQRVSIRRVIPC